MTMRFEKWQALGNDYLIVERDELPFELTPARVRQALRRATSASTPTASCCSRRQPDPADVAVLRIFNPDGSEAELSGNGAREAILYLRQRGWTDQDTFSIKTAAGEIRPTITGPDTCRVDMGRASAPLDATSPAGRADGRGERSSRAGREWAFSARLDRQPAVHDRRLELRAARSARPAGDRAGDRSRQPLPQPHERLLVHRARRPGGPSPAGSAHGSSSAGWGRRSPRAPARRARPSPTSSEYAGPGVTSAPVTVVLDGGELEVEVGADLQVHLTGWARPVFAGSHSDEFAKELHETE